MLLRLYFVFTFALMPLYTRAQSPSDNHIEAGRYVNTFLRFTYTWPEILRPVDIESLPLQRDPTNKNEFGLFSAKKTNGPFGVIMLAERVLTQPGWRDPGDFLALVKSSWDPKGNPVEISRTHHVQPGGLIWEELDYNIFNEYSSTLAAQTKGFLIVVRCSANNKKDLDSMSKSVLAITLQK